MAEKKGSRLFELIIAPLAVAAIIGVAGYLVGWWPPVWAGVKGAAVWSWGWLGSDHQLRGWLLALLIGLSGLTLLAVAADVLRWLFGAREPERAPWLTYVADDFEGVHWEWQYGHGDIVNLAAYCPSDAMLLAYSDTSGLAYATPKTVLICEHCGRRFGPYDGMYLYLKNRVKRHIDRKIRTGEYKEVLASAGA